MAEIKLNLERDSTIIKMRGRIYNLEEIEHEQNITIEALKKETHNHFTRINKLEGEKEKRDCLDLEKNPSIEGLKRQIDLLNARCDTHICRLSELEKKQKNDVGLLKERIEFLEGALKASLEKKSTPSELEEKLKQTVRRMTGFEEQMTKRIEFLEGLRKESPVPPSAPTDETDEKEKKTHYYRMYSGDGKTYYGIWSAGDLVEWGKPVDYQLKYAHTRIETDDTVFIGKE